MAPFGKSKGKGLQADRMLRKNSAAGLAEKPPRRQVASGNAAASKPGFHVVAPAEAERPPAPPVEEEAPPSDPVLDADPGAARPALTVDTSQGDYSTIEDCTVCCRPIQFEISCEPGEVVAANVNPG